MVNIHVLSENNSDNWKSFLQQLPLDQQDVYFTPEYYQLYEDLGDGKAQCFVFQKGKDIALYPFLLNSVNVLGYELDQEYFDIQGAYGYNGVISNSYDASFIDSFYKAFNLYCERENIIAEFTRFHPLLNNHKFSEKHLNVVFDRKTMYLDLKNDYQDIFRRFQTTTKKQIKRCYHKYNLEIEIIENDISKIEIFYAIYVETMKRVRSIYYLYFNKEYFINLILNTKSTLFLAKYEDKPIAGIIALHNNVYIHGHLGGALTEYLHTSAYSFLYSEMIKYGLAKGCRYLHTGGGNTNNIDDKLLQYKLNFSKTTAEFYIGKKIHDLPTYTNIVNQWESSNPEKRELLMNKILKYRF